jgi:YihY family inner membrane protein
MKWPLKRLIPLYPRNTPFSKKLPMIEKYFKPSSAPPGALVLAVKNYFRIGGAQSAAAFAYYAFFSLLPLLLLAVTITSFFWEPDRAAREVVEYFKNYAPLNAKTNQDLSDTIAGVVRESGGMTIITPLVFFWGAFRFFNVLIRAINRAWGTKAKSWWGLPLKNFGLLGITGLTILLGLAAPVTARMARNWLFSTYDFVTWIYDAAVLLGPLLVLFLGLSLLYRLAPCRPTRFVEVWSSALATAALLCVLESLFGIYIRNFAKFNVVYGAFGGMMALLMWIYLSGCLVVLGACLCAAQAQAQTPWWKNLPLIGGSST